MSRSPAAKTKKHLNPVDRVGSLTAVGCGIVAPAHATRQAWVQIESAHLVLSLVADPIAAGWLASVNPNVRSLAVYYAVGKPRRQTYEDMVLDIVGEVVSGKQVCAVSYGHPGVFAYPLHESIRRVRERGLSATMFPAVSAEDCLFADLGIDPAQSGCCSFEATDFLLYDRHIDETATLILWQIGVIGERSYKLTRETWNLDGVDALVERLRSAYPADHHVILYEAARLVTDDPTIEHLSLDRLASAPITTLSTLVVPPAAKPAVNRSMYARLTSGT